MVTEAIQQALPAAERLTAPASVSAHTAFNDVKPDFDRILDNLKELQDRVDRLTAIVTSEINIEDSKQSKEDNHNLTRLTWLATTFIPLSFVSAFFSMNESVAELKYTYGWFFLTAIPFTAICLCLARLVGGGSLGKRVMKKNYSTKGKSLYNKYFKFE
jgi:Mg2+ and Co2+ transporter CorA